MIKEVLLGMAAGVVVGALLVHSCPEAEAVVEKGKKIVKKNIDKIAKK